MFLKTPSSAQSELTDRQALPLPDTFSACHDAGGPSHSEVSYSRWVPPAFLLAIVVYAFIFFQLRPRIMWANADFACFYRAGKMVTEGQGAKVYDLTAQDDFDRKHLSEILQPGQRLLPRPFVSAPFILAIFAPLSYLPYREAELLWFLISVAILLLIPYLLRDILGRGKLMVFAILGPPLFLPVAFSLMQGQHSILLLLLFTLIFLQFAKGNEIRAGGLLALVAFKPQLALAVLIAMIVSKRWRVLAGFCAAGFVLFWLSTALVGFHATIALPEVLRQFDRLPQALGGVHPENMPNIRGMLYVLLESRVSPGIIQTATVAIGMALILFVAFRIRGRLVAVSDMSFALLVVTTLLASFHGYLYDLSLLVLPLLLVLSHIRQHGAFRASLAIVLTIPLLYVLPLISSTLGRLIVYLFLATSAFALEVLAALSGSDRAAGIDPAAALTAGPIGL